MIRPRSLNQQELMKLINDPTIKNFEKLKLFLIYALKYENSEYVKPIKNLLKEKKILSPGALNLCEILLNYGGQKMRRGDLFQNKGWIKSMAKCCKSVVKNVPNVFTQHKPYLTNVLKLAKENKLKETEYVTLDNDFAFQGPPREIIVLQTGGTTYEEAREVGLMNKSGDNVLLVGTYIHNTTTFLAELQQLSYERKDDVDI